MELPVPGPLARTSVPSSCMALRSADELAQQLDEPQYHPRPTVAVRLVSVLENAMTNEGQISYLKAYHRLGGWFPREARNPASVR